jgi:DUF971 family protein
MANAPENIRALQDDRVFEIVWSTDRTDRLPYKFLRGQCPCAGCVDEFTGIRTLDVNTVLDDIHPVNLSFTGNYALKILWSDTHDTGLYTWDRLEMLCRQYTAASE